MATLEMQPTFRVEVPGRVDDALRKLRRAIRSPELAGHAESAGSCLDFKIAHEDRRFWSPHLSVQLSEFDNEQGGPTTEVFGRFSPRPDIWTGVMLTYLSAVCLMFFAAVYGYVQWTLGSRPWALGAVPIGLVLVAALHTASLIGQRLSADQMRLLRARFDRACEIAFTASEAPLEG